jgi:hypothetical protein
MKVASKVIEHLGLTHFDFICRVSVGNIENFQKQNDFSKLRLMSNNFIVNPYKGGVSKYKKIKYLLYDFYCLFKMPRYDLIICSSIDDEFIQAIITYNVRARVLTYDDGSANYITSSMFYVSARNVFIPFLYKLVGNKLDINTVKNRIHKHYAINDYVNIVNNVEVISIFDSAVVEEEYRLEECNLILGPVFDELFVKGDCVKNKIMKMIELDDVFFIPHPRDSSIADSLNSLNGFLLAEEHISNLLMRYSKVNIFGFSSSAQVNVISNKSCVVYNFQVDCISERFLKSYHEVNELLIGLGAKEICIDDWVASP